MNKTEIIQKIKQLESLTHDERSYLVELVNTKKKYGLVWEDKPEDVEEQLRTHLPVLKEITDRRIEAPPQPSPEGREPKKTVQNLQQSLFEPEPSEQLSPEASPSGRFGGAPNHILIEGDNLHALTALTFTHEGKIDVMYFDPPYNTGNKDFKYNDSFVDREDSYRHSKWLSFMDKRLRIAKRLLSDKGVVFISIDDNESSQLKVLLDEIFLEINFVAEFIHKNNSNKNQAKLVGISTEYMYCYAKNKSSLKGIEWKVSKKGAKDIALVFNKLKKQGLELDEIEKEIKLLYQRPKYSHLSRWNKVNNNGVFKDADLSREGGPKDYTIINPETGNSCKIPERGWGKSYDELIRLQNENLIWYGSDDTPPGLIDYITIEDLTVPDSFLYFDNSVDTKWQKDVFGKIVFDNPKPLEMIQTIMEFQLVKDLIVLDIFAGSGTTLHATMQLNAEDGGNRQCILVTNNEIDEKTQKELEIKGLVKGTPEFEAHGICQSVTYERNRRVIQGYTSSKGQQVPGLTNNNLRYYKTEFVGREPSLKNKRELTKLATELLCIKEDCYTDVTRDLGNFSWHKLFTNGRSRFVYVVFDDLYIENAVDALKNFMATQNPEIKMKVYVFANGQYAYAEEFEDIAANITLAALPDAIYKAYQNVLPKENREFIPVLEDETIVEPQTDTNL